MKNFTRRGAARWLMFWALCPFSGAHAQDDYPQHPVWLVAAFSGGLSSLAAQSIAQKVGPALGQRIVINSLPGANGNIGLREVASAKPDGYTLLVGGQWLTTNWALNPAGWSDPNLNMTPIAPILEVPYVIVTARSHGIHTFKDLVNKGKQAAGGGGLSIGIPGIGTAAHLYGVSLGKAAGIKLLPVAYKGGGGELVGVLSGEVDFGVFSLISALPQIQSGQLVALAVTASHRVSALPDVPTIAEAGFQGFETSTWFALFGPRNLPPAVVEKLNRTMASVYGSPQGLAWVKSIGAEPMPEQSPDELRALTERESLRWQKVVRDLGIARAP
ncbi:tripartite-type tricarboxylate transporter receptor subunit TctC [Paraburkholderia sp. JPY465]|uniref:Bug family tripartite tricarboxylate transporter substrate binding protein n=1 Tax=Paraburkholderia sp. JPY465 TaxID=3042285 RepID=UPI003D1D3FA7